MSMMQHNKKKINFYFQTLTQFLFSYDKYIYTECENSINVWILVFCSFGALITEFMDLNQYNTVFTAELQVLPRVLSIIEFFLTRLGNTCKFSSFYTSRVHVTPWSDQFQNKHRLIIFPISIIFRKKIMK